VIVGFDVYHGGAGSRGASIRAMVATIDPAVLIECNVLIRNQGLSSVPGLHSQNGKFYQPNREKPQRISNNSHDNANGNGNGKGRDGDWQVATCDGTITRQNCRSIRLLKLSRDRYDY